MRELPCLCENCRNEDFDDCEHVDYVGEWDSRKMVKKGMRVANARYQKNSRKIVRGNKVFTVESVVGRAFFEGVTQYQVYWVGYDEPSWIEADKLNYIDLIEEYENEPVPE